MATAARRVEPQEPSVNDELLDQTIRHAVDLERYSNSVVRRLITLLNRTEADLLAQLDVALGKVRSNTTIQRLEELLAGVRELNAAAYRRIGRELTAELKEFTEVELDWETRLLEKQLPPEVLRTVGVVTVAPETVAAAALARPFQGVLLKEALSDLEEGRAQLVREAVRQGVVEGETIDQIVRRLRGTKAMGYADGLLERPRHHLEALVRTAVNHTATYARTAFMQANTDLVAGWVFTATLDSRTSLTCASLHGRRYDVGTGPIPPRHWNCRSTMVPVTKSWRNLGLNLDELEPGTRASMDGQVPADLTFTKWLRKQSAERQDEVLGATRGKLFRAGNLEVTSFTNNKGIVYSLDQLRQRHAALFEKAGV